MASYNGSECIHDSKDQHWSISPYPDKYRFGFTIVHDADSSYSKRLAPLFYEFDRLGFAITVTVFPFWAEWAHNGQIWKNWNKGPQEDRFLNPIAVPLEDESERTFYLELKCRGHEIAMHTPSETSSTREDLVKSFSYFRNIFGEYPKVYVEHSRTNNKDAQVNKGSNPLSEYYNTDLINQFGSWVCVDYSQAYRGRKGHYYFDALEHDNSPFDQEAFEQFGVQKGFIRTGGKLSNDKRTDACAFLNAYSEENIDSLEKNRGLALAHTHLDYEWLNPSTRSMQQPIIERLEYISEKNGWFVPASTILDRFRLMMNISICSNKQWLKICNIGEEKITGVTLVSHNGFGLKTENTELMPDEDGNILIGTIKGKETLTYLIQQ